MCLPGSFDCVVFSTKDSVFFFLISKTFLPFIRSNLIGPSVEFLAWMDADWWICISQIQQCTLGVQTIQGGCIVARIPCIEYSHLSPKQTQQQQLYWCFHRLGQKCLTASRNVFVSTISIEERQEIRCDSVCCISVERKSVFSMTYSLQWIAAATQDQRQDNHVCAFSLAGVSCFIFSRPRLNNAACVHEISAVAPLKKVYNP